MCSVFLWFVAYFFVKGTNSTKYIIFAKSQKKLCRLNVMKASLPFLGVVSYFTFLG